MSIADLQLLAAFGASVFLLIFMIAKYGVSPILSLLAASITLALIAGLPLTQAFDEFSQGVGAVLGSTAMIIALGAMIGVLLQDSGGAEVIARRLIDLLGERHLSWTMLVVGLLVGVGVWFTVGLVLLVPITFSLARTTKTNVLIPGMSMLAGLSAMHGLTPPHPGPLAAIALLDANLGQTILWSLIVGAIAATISGPLFWHFFKATLDEPESATVTQSSGDATNTSTDNLAVSQSPGFFAPMAVIVLPIVLMLCASFLTKAAPLTATENSAAESLAANQQSLQSILLLFSNSVTSAGIPTVAMLIGLCLAIWLLGWRCGKSTREITKITEASLYPVANVLLVVGAGAGFSRILIASGVGKTLAELAMQVPLPTLVLAWLIAAAFRVATGSATTAITAGGGIASAFVTSQPELNREFLVLALGAGSLTLSHVNDGGFWFVKEYFGLSVTQTLKSWTVLETVLSIVALLAILLLDLFF